MQVADADFVYVNQDGSVRELSPDERDYLAQAFHPNDGARPYLKSSYESQDGWGSVSGFLLRRRVPRSIVIEPVNPDYVPPKVDLLREDIEDGRAVGDIVTENPDGSVSTSPNPRLERSQRFEMLRQRWLRRQRAREDLARHPAYARRPEA